ncbi:hypothetical protein B1H19_03345 [Streptomyces gilvosporeus]|uniref:Uncharacterized protein n=1 Tax=Streptomyces gilvosporeus TaxID=553510 RepID=A0A1V0TK56_9ACTN|nr:hypothetical protein B1H19_03345 [Streptomyces gilvosporeus]
MRDLNGSLACDVSDEGAAEGEPAQLCDRGHTGGGHGTGVGRGQRPHIAGTREQSGCRPFRSSPLADRGVGRRKWPPGRQTNSGAVVHEAGSLPLRPFNAPRNPGSGCHLGRVPRRLPPKRPCGPCIRPAGSVRWWRDVPVQRPGRHGRSCGSLPFALCCTRQTWRAAWSDLAVTARQSSVRSVPSNRRAVLTTSLHLVFHRKRWSSAATRGSVGEPTTGIGVGVCASATPVVVDNRTAPHSPR